MNRVRMQTDRAKIWKVIRAHKEGFTSADIEILTDATYINIKRYLKILADAGYLRRKRKANLNGKGTHWVYRLVKNTGPKPPVQKALRFLFDPNTNEYWVEDPEAVIRRG